LKVLFVKVTEAFKLKAGGVDDLSLGVNKTT